MTDIPYNGFRFEHSRPSINAPGGVLKVHYISVQQSYEAALAAMADLVGGTHGLQLLDHGEAVLNEAVTRGIGNGQTVAL